VTPAKPLVIPANEATAIRLDGWYISLNTKRFIGVDLQIVPDDTLPTLPIIGWHLDKTNRIRKEIQALWREGYFGRLELYDLVDTPPIEICLIVDKPQSKNVFIVITKADYPASAPTVRAVPTADVDPAAPDFFMTLWNKAMPLPQDVYPAWEWTADRLIVDLIKAIEAKLAEGTVAK
jgi:hypothetical protein